MKNFFLALFLVPMLLYTQNKLPYGIGEYSAFDISFGGITVGVAEIEIVENYTIDSISTFHIIGRGKTAYFFDWFFKVRDVYETYLDTAKIIPVKFVRDIYEGGYEKKQLYKFNHLDSLVLTTDSSYKIPHNSQDMLSALFYARTFNTEQLKQKGSFVIPVFIDEENYFLEVEYMNNEIIDTKWGMINCMVFKPIMQEGRVFKDVDKMQIWITDDPNHLLVKVETKIWAGLIKAHLVKYKKLKYPLSISK
ncbi:MAG: hypothetical protein CMD16_03315 [Flavobacteriales bacterium]|mgnify:CR=1 FL=1|nr:hypothetical protein [Flavobacteriales bacterium]|tara:strand:- start:9197 stop:9946 length:750 start_codon:yes stop_codon:yes gene_type:complete